MTLLWPSLMLIVGPLLLVKGADFFVQGASSLAKRFHISPLFIGLTIVAFGTSAPELVVSLTASMMGNNDIAIANVLGSNTANIFLILGISALIFPLTVTHGTVWKEIPFAFLSVIAMLVMAKHTLADPSLVKTINGMTFEGLTRTDGIVLLLFFIIFFYYLIGIARNTKDDGISIPSLSVSRSFSLLFTGLTMLVLGGTWMVEGASAIARILLISEAVIGLTIVALGTSLPELATSAVAAFKKEVDIAVGNIVGSNIFNILFVLSLSSVVNPLSFSQGLIDDAWMTVFATFLLFLFMFIGKRHTLERWQGAGFLILYLVYLGYLFTQG